MNHSSDNSFDTNRLPDSDDQLDWQAFLYVSGELDESDSVAFEALLADDPHAQQALIRAVEIIEISAQLKPEQIKPKQLKSGDPLPKRGEPLPQPPAEAPDFISSITDQSLVDLSASEVMAASTEVTPAELSRALHGATGTEKSSRRFDFDTLFKVAAAVLVVVVASVLLYLSGAFGTSQPNLAANQGNDHPVAKQRAEENSSLNHPSENGSDLNVNDSIDDRMLDALANVWMGSSVDNEHEISMGDSELSDMVFDEYSSPAAPNDHGLLNAKELEWIDKAWNELILEQEQEQRDDEIML